MYQRLLSLALALVMIPMSACMSPSGDTPAQQRANGIEMRDEAMQHFKEHDKMLQPQMDNAAGYIVWNGTSLHPGLASFAAGYMVATDNATQKVRYRKFFRFGVGPGLAIKGFYGMAIVPDRATMDKLMTESSFNMASGVDASFIFGSFGGSATATAAWGGTLHPDLHTHTGFAIEAFLAAGMWTWLDTDLNDTQ